MRDHFIVKVEILSKPRVKHEIVRLHTRDFSLDIEQPMDEITQAALGNNFKGYFKARQFDDQLVLLSETTWTEWNKGRLSE